jgi:hypothetical protein
MPRLKARYRYASPLAPLFPALAGGSGSSSLDIRAVAPNVRCAKNFSNQFAKLRISSGDSSKIIRLTSSSLLMCFRRGQQAIFVISSKKRTNSTHG